MSPSSAVRFIRPAAGASLARPTAGAAVGAITTLNTTSPNASSAVNCAKNARRSLQAEHLKPALAVVEQKVSPPCTRTVKEIRSMVEHFKAVPDFRGRFESYPPRTSPPRRSRYLAIGSDLFLWPGLSVSSGA